MGCVNRARQICAAGVCLGEARSHGDWVAWWCCDRGIRLAKGRGGAKGKYTEENVQRCLDAIALYGTDKAGYTAIPISVNTFYKWIAEKNEFSQGVAAARQQWQESQGSSAKLQAWSVLKRYLFEGQVEHWTVVKDVYVAGGEGGPGQVMQLTETRTIRRPTPQWVIERYLGKGMHELEALQAIAAWLPQTTLEAIASEINHGTEAIRQVFTGAIASSGDSARRPGLTDETAGAIRSQILGVDASDPAAVSGAVGAGQKPGQDNAKVTTDRD